MSTRTTLLSWALAAALALPAVASAADLSARLLALGDAGADYAAERSALVLDDTITDAELQALSRSDDWRLAGHAAVVLAWRSDAEAMGALEDAEPLATRIPGRVRFPRTMAELDVGTALFFERLLHGSADAAQRYAAAEALGESQGEWEPLGAALVAEHDDAGVREALVMALRRSDHPAARDAIAAALGDGVAEVRLGAAVAAASSPYGASLAPQLVALLDDPADDVRAESARSLGILRYDGARAALEGRLLDNDGTVRLRALKALDRIDPEAAKRLPELQRLQADSDDRVRRLVDRLRER